MHYTAGALASPMIDKMRHRHRLLRPPQGQLPNWVVAVLAVGLFAVGVLLQQLI